MLRLLYFIPMWILHTIAQLPLLILGYVLIPLMAGLKRYEVRQSKLFNKQIVTWTDKFMWLWGNEEDGIDCDTYWKSNSEFLKIVYWSAMRNPVGNLRFTPGFVIKVDQRKVNFTGSKVNDLREYDYNIPMWYLCWQGPFASYRRQFRAFGGLWRLWIGWKIYPEDSIYPVTGHRLFGAGFAYQFKKLDENKLSQ